MKRCLLTLVVFCACKQKEEFIRSSAGMEYKIVQRDAGGVPVSQGQYLKLSVTQYYGDTVLRDPSRTGYEYQLVDSSLMSRETWALFHKARINDSIVFRVSSDAAFAKKKPAFVKHKDWLVTTVKVLSILENADSVQADRERDQLKRNYR